MDTSSFTSPRKSENVSLDQATNFLNQVRATAGFETTILALFGEQISATSGSYMVPAVTGQANGSALWVSGGQSLTDMGIDPANDLVYFQLWIESKGHYVCVGDCIRELKNNGNSIALA